MNKNEKKPGEQVLATSRTTTPGGTCTDCHVDFFTVHVFFDGTGNNRFNTEVFRESSKKARRYINFVTGIGSVSYENYYSNIALLFMAIKVSKVVKAIYIEGAGTVKYKADTRRGMMLGWAEAGREARIEEAFEKLEKTVDKVNKSRVILNVYGFSRGASWARHFCHLVKAKNSKWKQSKINFVGIYDTVSSDGIEIHNDIEELGLDIGKAEEINYIAHLTAQNDYREKFPLTPIHRAIKDGIGFECSFPGAHSNLGGGYEEIDKDKDKFLGLVDVPAHEQGDEYIDIEWFKRKGYYNDSQITEAPAGLLKNKKQYVGNREVLNNYQFITCDAMRLIAENKANYALKKESDFKVGVNNLLTVDELNKFHQVVLKYIQDNFNKKGDGYVVPMLPDEEMITIYNQYIHNSLEYGSTAGGGTKDNKTISADGKLDYYSNPTRPQVQKGYKADEPLQ